LLRCGILFDRRGPDPSSNTCAGLCPLTIRLRRRKNTNSPFRDSSNRPQFLATDKVEGTVRAEKNDLFDGHQPQQRTRGAMAGTQRYLRYIVFALVV
jgi:hypothetical protein